MYSIVLSQKALHYLKELDKNIETRLRKRLKRLEENPVPTDTKFLGRHQNDKVFRYRIGDYRALYKIKDKEKVVLITKIDKRPKVYKAGF